MGTPTVGSSDPGRYDVIVVGGSFAGLSAALQVARARRRVLVVDAGNPRNRFAAHSHGFLGQDGRARQPQGDLTAGDLLLYSAVCGTGLDTLPLPGDVKTAQLQAILLDLAALSQRLDKPLTARLMPIPGKKAGDRTEFDFPYFANSRVLSLRASPLHGLLRLVR